MENELIDIDFTLSSIREHQKSRPREYNEDIYSLKQAFATLNSDFSTDNSLYNKEKTNNAIKKGDFSELIAVINDKKQQNNEINGVFFRLFDLKQAKNCYLKAVEEKNSPLSAWICLAEILFQENDLTRAELNFQYVLDRAGFTIKRPFAWLKKQNKELSARAMYGISLIALKNADLKKASWFQQAALKTFQKNKNKLYEALSLENMGIIYRSGGNPERAEVHLYQAANIFTDIDFLDAAADCYGNIALVRLLKDDIDGSEELHTRSMNINQELNRKESIASQHCNLGFIAKIKGQLDIAEQHFSEAISISEECNDTKGQAIAYTDMAEIMRLKNAPEKAEKFLLSAKDCHEKLDNITGQADVYSALGLILQETGKLEEAEKYLLKSMDINRNSDRRNQFVNDCGILGLIYMEQDKLDKAEEMYKKSLAVEKRTQGIASDYGNLGLIEKKKGNFEKAVEHWKTAIEYFEKDDPDKHAEQMHQIKEWIKEFS